MHLVNVLLTPASLPLVAAPCVVTCSPKRALHPLPEGSWLQTIVAKLHEITVNEFLPIIASLRVDELKEWTPLANKPDISVEVRVTSSA